MEIEIVDNEGLREISALLDEATKLVGRPVEVEKTTDGKYVVLFLSFSEKPPPKGDTVKEALENFIAYRKETNGIPGKE